MSRSLRIVLAVIFAGLLTACGVNSAFPSTQLVKRAIALQVAQTQQELSQQLRLEVPKSATVEITRVNIAKQEPLTIQDLTAYRVQGTFDFMFKRLKGKMTQPDNPFDVYLQRQSDEKTWRLAQQLQEEEGDRWVTQLLK